MHFRRRFITVLLGLFFFGALLLLYSYHESKQLKRDALVLINTYYKIKAHDSVGARRALDIILEHDPDNITALMELSQWLMQEEKHEEAIPHLTKLTELLPHETQYRFQLAHAHRQVGDWERAQAIFFELLDESSEFWQERTKASLKAMHSYIPNYKDWVSARFIAHDNWQKQTDEKSADYHMNQFYALKRKQHPKARHYIEKITVKYPKHITALKEAGLLAIQEGRVPDAIDAFSRAYEISGDPELAMQLGYLYVAIGQNKQGYRYFNYATFTENKQLELLAQDAMTRLQGQQTKDLPDPYFGEFFFMPFSQSRFGITVSQFIARLGVEFPVFLAPRFYGFTRRTQDNKSANLGELTELFEDNVWVTGMGSMIFPFKKIPTFFYVEGGAARDLIDQGRERWRPDLRAGMMYYQEFGKMPSYYDKPKYSLDYYSIWYAEATYFSRYDNNVIASIRTHQGIRLFQYKSTMLNLFIRGRVIEDTNRDFFNNFAELGPALGIVPSNRYNFEIHFDYINGVYLPAGGKERNPYAKTYSNKRVLLLAYVKG